MKTLTHLESSLLDGELAEDSGAVIRTDGLQLVFVQREELSAGQDTQTVDRPAEQTNKLHGYQTNCTSRRGGNIERRHLLLGENLN